MNIFRTYPYSNCTILRITDDKDIIDTNPEYQRPGDIWGLEKRQLFIDSIMNSYDIPKLYFHVLEKSETYNGGQKTLYSIIDGRQRLETIWAFVEDKISLADDFIFNENPQIKAGGLWYSELTNKFPKLRIRFDSFVLPVICVETEQIGLIEEMFSRLNEAVPLNAAEKRNAIGGSMAKTINNIALHNFFTEKAKFRNNRYQHKEVSARLLFLEENILKKKIYDTKKPFLDEMVRKYKRDASLKPKKDENTVKTILDTMNGVFDDKDALLGSSSVIPIYFLLFRTAYKQNQLEYIARSKLVEFKNKVRENLKIAEIDMSKADYDLYAYHNLSVQGTNDAGSIKERLRIISKYFGIDVMALD